MTQPLPEVPILPILQSSSSSDHPMPNPCAAEPVRELNLYFARLNVVPEIIETLAMVGSASQVWTCTVNGGGLSVSGSGGTKKAAKKVAAKAFLSAVVCSKST